MPTTAELTENSRQGFAPENPDRIGFDAELSRNLRWGCDHAYDETVVGLAVYVRNDPVNGVDPNGRETIYINGGSVTVTANLPGVDPIAAAFGLGIAGAFGGGSGFDQMQIELTDLGIDPFGGGGGRFIRVKNPSKGGANQDRIRAVLNWIKTNVDKDCANWLGGIGGAIDSILGDPADERTVLIGHGEFDDSAIGAFTGNAPSQTDIPDGYAMTVNDTGLFFKSISGMTAGGYNGGTSQAQVFIMLHELGHWLNAGGYQSDFDNQDAGKSNDNLVKQKCGKTLNGAKNIP